ncbi:AAA family ATPase [Polynucleobacter sp. AP-Reno-20A-A9]|uniref:AAA family ATPase n=1 Tax=Polynucleobacter sp. AP-Reno-20A-A9 TaxID=2576925 RepID=UPI001C0BD758|nr:AAA family ATPase [Polynucleobacter sp. AP-Reno-20A-A9]MBU3627994.1 AAA family ATPase [Polynucleobacter sp. AP-Reno-20A-A9]
MSFLYSRGTDMFDNAPAQMVADSFSNFAEAIANDKSSRKGLTYICSPLSEGIHYEKPAEYLGIANWRLKNYGLPRQFLPFDFDGFESPEIFDQVCELLRAYDCLIYTTASHSEGAPRARAILALNRATEPEEGEQLGRAMQMHIESEIGIGKIKFDTSVYRATQPIFTPVTTSEIIRHNGMPLDVDKVLNDCPATRSRSTDTIIETLTSINRPTFQLPNSAISEGNRNEMMLRYVGHLRGRGFKEDEIVALAMALNKAQFSPPLDHAEILDICSRYQHQSRELGNELGSTQSPISMYTFFKQSEGDLEIQAMPPPKRSYVFSDQVPMGTMCVLGGSGGVSKTMLALQMAIASACGKDLGHIQVAEGTSLLFLGEEDKAERDRRIGAICSYMHADPKLVQKRVKCFGAAGIDMRLTQKTDGNVQATILGNKVTQMAQEHAAWSGSPLRIIVFDHARLVLGGDPNDAEDVTQLTRVLTHIAKETGAAVFLLAHSPKSVMAKKGDEMNSGDIAGSSAFVDNSRASFMMWTMRDDEAKTHHVPSSERTEYVRLENVKANYARTGGGYWLKRVYMPDWDVALLEPVYLHSKSLFQAKGISDLQDKILRELRKRHGGISERRLRDMAGKDGVLNASDTKVRAAIDAMLEEGLIERRPPTTEEKNLHKLAGQVREVLVACTP